ncbi:threonine synthase [Mucisphaera calidilacus]|uniref:Threonine synthase n=1 Tax=Mucisphaera calidilacus TaxID=2527982 RepID=A0A518BW40_9BACT|nr:threonine synthase [Mucisphaera calidilacus]QDU71196.1 Threonine synthase [Mucisphaera calidilacus]
MKYISTRGQAPALGFEETMLAGLATDGGLYVPESWPTLSAETIRGFRGQRYQDVAFAVMRPFVAGEISDEDLRGIIEGAYGRFRHRAVCPLVQVGPDEHVMELFHGPTLAFKDVAMQVLGRMYDLVLERRDDRITIVGATSGDTGSAAIEAIRGRSRASIFIMHPHGRTSDVQRKQMTTVRGPGAENVHNVAIEGTFDDCQNLLKAMFNDAPFREEIRLSGVNSINWARVMPQVVYYVTSAVSLGAPDREVAFSVPTGNFGDIFAGYIAKQMGLPIRRLIVASNSNDILTRALTRGDHTLGEVVPTMSPSMDIQISSNFERLLFDLYGRDGAVVSDLMAKLKSDGGFGIESARLDPIRDLFAAGRVDEATTLETIKAVHDETDGYLIDPHTAVGVRAAREVMAGLHAEGVPVVTLATAHPAKFPDAVSQATGVKPPLPEHLQDLYEREEKYAVLGNDLTAVEGHIRAELAR